MNEEDFKTAAVASLLTIKERIGVKTIALDLFEIYGMKKGVETWQRHISACFDPKRPEFFAFCDVVNMCRLYGIHDPMFFLCDSLGYERPQQRIDFQAELAVLRSTIPEIRRQLEEMEGRRLALELSAQPASVVVARFSQF